MTRQARYVTKSIRLSEEEARELAALVERQPASESALMRQWVLEGMQRFRVDQTVAAYQRDEVDLSEGAAMAGIPIGLFVDELAERHVAILRDPKILQHELEQLMEEFGSPEGKEAVRRVTRSGQTRRARGQTKSA